MVCRPRRAVVYNVGMHTTQTDEHRAAIGRALKKGIRDAYDHLGLVILASLATLAGTAALTALGLRLMREARPGTFLGAALLTPAALYCYLCHAGAVYLAHRAIYHNQLSPEGTWKEMRTLLLAAAQLFVVDLAAMGVLLGDSIFFLSLKPGPAGAVPAVACIYAAGIWAAAAVYHLPLLVAQLRMESGPRPLVVIKKSFLLALGCPGFTLGLFVAIISLAVLCAIPAGLGMATLFPGAAAFLLTHGLRELFVRYGIVEEEPDVVEDRGWPGSGKA